MLQLAVAERVDAIVEMNQPGVWVLGSARDQDRAIGMGVVVEYADRKGEPQWKAPANPTWDYSVFGEPSGTRTKYPEPDGKFDLTFKMLADEGKPFNRWTCNDKFWPDIDPLMVNHGKRYRLALHNGMEDGHPIHLHRHSFELVKHRRKTDIRNHQGHRERASRHRPRSNSWPTIPAHHCCIATCSSTWTSDSRRWSSTFSRLCPILIR